MWWQICNGGNSDWSQRRTREGGEMYPQARRQKEVGKAEARVQVKKREHIRAWR